jgi:hypothetical protein
MKTSIQINSFFNPDQTRLNNDFIPDLIISSIVIKQISIRINHDFNPDQSWLLIQIYHEFNPDQSWLQSASIATLNQNSIMTFYSDLSWLQSGSINSSIQIYEDFNQINPFFNPDQTRLNYDFVPDLIISSIVIKQDFNPDQSWLHTWFNHGLNPDRTRLQSRSIITTYPDLSWIQSRSISRFPSGSIMTIFPDL